MTTDVEPSGRTEAAAVWRPIATLAAGIGVLVTSEFLPAGVLPTIADDIGVSDGTAGLAVAFTAIAGAVTAPTISLLLPRADRRLVLVALLGLGAAADLTVLVAPNFPVLLAGRLLLGVAIAGYWAFSFGAGVQVVPGKDHLVSTALALGVSVATVVGVPIAAVVDDHLGWRTAFAGVTGAGVVVAAGLALALPPVPAHRAAGLPMMRLALRNRHLLACVALTGLVVAGNFAAYPYIRLAVDRVAPSADTWLLLGWGVGGMVGNLSAGAFASRLRLLALGAPVLLGVGLALTVATESVAVLGVAIGLWGFAFNMIPVATQLWAVRAEPERAESAIGLSVTAFQLAVVIGSSLGGVLVDQSGVPTTFALGALAALLGGIGFGSVRLPRR